MRTTINIDDKLVKSAAELTGISEKTSLVRMGLESLIAAEGSRRLASLGGVNQLLELHLAGDAAMVLVDTSVWINHFHKSESKLQNLLYELNVACHPFIVGELACGTIKNRAEILTLLQGLPTCSRVSDKELLYFIEQHKLMGKGIGFVDIHLLASAKLMGYLFWTADKRLYNIASEMGLSFASK